MRSRSWSGESVIAGVYSRKIRIIQIFLLRVSFSVNGVEIFKKSLNVPNAQFLGSTISGESTGTSGLKNGRNMMYALESNTSGNTFNVP